MAETPERIWATVNGMRSVFPGGKPYLIGGWDGDLREHDTEYVRADIHETALAAARREALEEAANAVAEWLGEADLAYAPGGGAGPAIAWAWDCIFTRVRALSRPAPEEMSDG